RASSVRVSKKSWTAQDTLKRAWGSAFMRGASTRSLTGPWESRAAAGEARDARSLCPAARVPLRYAARQRHSKGGQQTNAADAETFSAQVRAFFVQTSVSYDHSNRQVQNGFDFFATSAFSRGIAAEDCAESEKK